MSPDNSFMPTPLRGVVNGSLVLVALPDGLDAAKKALVAARWDDDEHARVVIVGKAKKSNSRLLRELILEATPAEYGMTFRTVQYSDGTRCTCASSPCIVNCCACTASKERSAGLGRCAS